MAEERRSGLGKTWIGKNGRKKTERKVRKESGEIFYITVSNGVVCARFYGVIKPAATGIGLEVLALFKNEFSANRVGVMSVETRVGNPLCR